MKYFICKNPDIAKSSIIHTNRHYFGLECIQSRRYGHSWYL